MWVCKALRSTYALLTQYHASTLRHYNKQRSSPTTPGTSSTERKVLQRDILKKETWGKKIYRRQKKKTSHTGKHVSQPCFCYTHSFSFVEGASGHYRRKDVCVLHVFTVYHTGWITMVLVQCSGRKKLIVTALLAELLKSCNVMKLCTCMVCNGFSWTF